MRLTCPNCGARYEVDDALIPPEGRDVQCSDCVTTWFQPGPRVVAPAPQAERPVFPGTGPETGQDTSPETAPETAPETDPETETETASEDGHQPSRDTASDAAEPEAHPPEQADAPAPAEPDTTETDPPPAEPERHALSDDPDLAAAMAPVAPSGPSSVQPDEGPLTQLPENAESATQIVAENDLPEPAETAPDAPQAGPSGQRGIDPDVRDILRAEAEREARLRRAEADPVETQSEMPLDAAQGGADPARRRAQLEDAEDAYTVGAASAAHANGSRRDLLPDIEEINSTLRATEDRRGAEGEDTVSAEQAAAATRRRGVRLGFFATLAVMGALIWIYFNGEVVTETVPGVAGAVDGFTQQVDVARLWLDDLARGLATTGDDS